MVKYIQNYVLYEQIGSGVYGKVYRSINNTDKKEYAIKVIPINKFKQNKKLEQCTVNEINILSNIESHANIIKYFDMLKTSNNFYFIYQYCNGGTLQNLLAKQGKLPESIALTILKQLLEAFQILNKYNIMHRDMKPDNIFFHNGIIKLGDFGFCKNLNSANQMTKTMLGSPIYMAPEVLKGQIYSNKADIWSLGVVIYEMIFGMCPFQSNSIANLIEVLNSKDLQFPGPLSPFLKTLISGMLTKDPIRRISWMELFQIQINSIGEVVAEKITSKINSIHQAKILEEGHISQSNKFIGKIDSMGNMDEPPARDFKKNRNMSTNSHGNKQNGNLNINLPNSSNYNSPQPSPMLNLPTLPSVPQVQSPVNPNMLQPTNNKLNGTQFTEPHTPKSPSYVRVSDDHKLVIEGVKLSMDIIQSKLPNHMGYAHLLLTRALSLITQLQSRTSKKDILDMLEKETREIQVERDMINSKMFAYELKGLEDWKKYLRGKFFQEENTIMYWFKLVTYLNGSYANYNLNQISPAEVVKMILY